MKRKIIVPIMLLLTGQYANAKPKEQTFNAPCYEVFAAAGRVAHRQYDWVTIVEDKMVITMVTGHSFSGQRLLRLQLFPSDAPSPTGSCKAQVDAQRSIYGDRGDLLKRIEKELAASWPGRQP